jgi:hypothetical protein
MVVEISAMDVVSAELKNRVDNKERNFFWKRKVSVLGQSYSLHGLDEMVVLHIRMHNQRKYSYSTHQYLSTLLNVFQAFKELDYINFLFVKDDCN